jgi:hypothetical protein|tara:strand:+ start:142 stop:474 length:333 start_codon:yes stop_codon:yes gene_type:complete
MFFILSKIFWFLVNPSNLFVILSIAGWGLLWKKPMLGKVLIGAAILLMFISSQKSGPEFMTKILVNRFEKPAIIKSINGIIVLIGIVDINRSRKGLIALNSNVERIVENN